MVSFAAQVTRWTHETGCRFREVIVNRKELKYVLRHRVGAIKSGDALWERELSAGWV